MAGLGNVKPAIVQKGIKGSAYAMQHQDHLVQRSILCCEAQR